MEEIWKDIKEYEGLYQISNLGKVKSLKNNKQKKEKILKLLPNSGYSQVILYKDGTRKHFSVHRLVALCFLLKINNKLEVNHKNGIRTDNKVENIEWVTPSENVRHAFNIGLMSHKEENHPQSKFTKRQVRRIKWINKNIKINHNYLIKLSKSLNISYSTVYNIIYNHTWREVII